MSQEEEFSEDEDDDGNHEMTPNEMNMEEAECETILDRNPFDKGARMRLS